MRQHNEHFVAIYKLYAEKATLCSHSEQKQNDYFHYLAELESSHSYSRLTVASL